MNRSTRLTCFSERPETREGRVLGYADQLGAGADGKVVGLRGLFNPREITHRQVIQTPLWDANVPRLQAPDIACADHDQS